MSFGLDDRRKAVVRCVPKSSPCLETAADFKQNIAHTQKSVQGHIWTYSRCATSFPANPAFQLGAVAGRVQGFSKNTCICSSSKMQRLLAIHPRTFALRVLRLARCIDCHRVEPQDWDGIGKCPFCKRLPDLRHVQGLT